MKHENKKHRNCFTRSYRSCLRKRKKTILNQVHQTVSRFKLVKNKPTRKQATSATDVVELNQEKKKKTLEWLQLFEVTEPKLKPKCSKIIDLPCPLTQQSLNTIKGRLYTRVEQICMRTRRFRFKQMSFNTPTNKMMKNQPAPYFNGCTIQYLVNPVLLERFTSRAKSIASAHGNTKTIWAFHATSSFNVASLAKNGFYTPVHPNYVCAHGQVHGAGVYLTTNPLDCVKYAIHPQGQQGAIVLCRVIVGKTSINRVLPGGCALPGYDSNKRNNVFVVFESDRILPVYVIDFTNIRFNE